MITVYMALEEMRVIPGFVSMQNIRKALCACLVSIGKTIDYTLSENLCFVKIIHDLRMFIKPNRRR